MKTILIIDDNADLLQNTAEILKSEKYNVLTAADGEAGVESARKKQPHIILCDVKMPEMDGYEVLKKLKQNISTSRIPIVFASCGAEKEDIKAGLAYGADGYLCKPFSRNQLLEELKRFS